LGKARALSAWGTVFKEVKPHCLIVPHDFYRSSGN
jgi:hypothetical protein